MSAGERRRPHPIILQALLSSFLLIAACGTPTPEPLESGRLSGAPTQSFKNLELRESTEGRLEWVLRAETAWKLSTGGATRLADLRVDFYQGSEEIRSVLTADSGHVDTQAGTLMAEGNVIVVTKEGNRLETEQLSWDRKNAKVVSEVAVKMIHGRDVLTGVGFESDPDLEHFELFEDVRASVHEGGTLNGGFWHADSTDRTR